MSSNLNNLKCWCIYTELKCSNSQILFVMPLLCFVRVGITWILPVIHLLNIVCLKSILFESDSWHESVNIKKAYIKKLRKNKFVWKFHKNSSFLFFNMTDFSVFYLDSQGFNIVCSICSPCEIWQVELNLIPAIIQPHWHGTDEWLDSCGTLVIASSKSPPDIFVI